MSQQPRGAMLTPLRDPAEIPELMIVLAAMAARADPGRFRLLDIACINGHRLAQVIKTTIGPVLYTGGAGRPGAAMLAGLEPWDRICAYCRCRSANLPASFITGHLAAGRRRVIYP